MRNEIVTSRLILRPIGPDDAEMLFKLIDNWNVVRWLSSVPWPYQLADMEKFINQTLMSDKKTGKVLFVIVFDGRVGGLISSCSPQLESGFSAGTTPDAGPLLGFWLGEAFWGQGIMTEAATALICHIFHDRAVNAVYSGAFIGNEASLHLHKKLGFERDKILKIYSKPQARELDLVRLVLHRTQYEKDS